MRLDRLFPLEGGVALTLSRRNCEELLRLLDNKDIPSDQKYLYKVSEEYQMISVAIEENDIHYERVQKELE